jgi:DNA mismatch repair protein MutS
MPDQIIFLHQVQPGGADKSYGIEAGRLAGLPPSVIQRARDVMKEIERGLRGEKQKPPRSRRRAKENNGVYDPSEQLDLFGA